MLSTAVACSGCPIGGAVLSPCPDSGGPGPGTKVGGGGERAVWGLPVGLDRLLKISEIPDLGHYMERKLSLKG